MTAPRPIAGPCAWLGKDMANSTRWVRALGAAAIATVDAALQGVRGLDWRQVTCERFPLPGLDRLFADISEELENGSGMVKLRGLPVERYASEDLRRIWFGLGCHLGTPVFQNRRGELMRDIRDEGMEAGRRYGELEKRDGGGKFLSSYARTLTSGPLRFHTDRCDVVGLLCVRQALKGGLSRLSSSAAVHNAMLKRRPDLAEALYRPVWRSRFGEEAENNDAVYPLPVFGQRDGKFTSHYSLTYIEAAEMAPGAPKPEPKQREAIDMLMALANELSFDMTLEPGDMQFVNNHVIYHARTAFEDDAGSGQDRLLYRLWLTVPNNRALPPGHEVLWRNIAAGQPRGGIGQIVA
ncbi:MAG: TauD/TfdA family dioxygenase [Rhodospirillales bacterium]